MINKAILFDLDGTLVETAPDLMSAHNHVMEKYGFEKINIQFLNSITILSPVPVLDENSIIPQEKLYSAQNCFALLKYELIKWNIKFKKVTD